MAEQATDTLVAAAASDAVQTAPPELWGAMLRSFGMLMLVLALLILVLWFLRRHMAGHGTGGQPELMKMLSSMYVAPKERIALVDVLGEKILIGITPQQISFLARIEDDRDLCSGQAAEPPRGFFKTLLKRKLTPDSKDSEARGDGH